jgi:hypothetical protein
VQRKQSEHWARVSNTALSHVAYLPTPHRFLTYVDAHDTTTVETAAVPADVEDFLRRECRICRRRHVGAPPSSQSGVGAEWPDISEVESSCDTYTEAAQPCATLVHHSNERILLPLDHFVQSRPELRGAIVDGARRVAENRSRRRHC